MIHHYDIMSHIVLFQVSHKCFIYRYIGIIPQVMMLALICRIIFHCSIRSATKESFIRTRPFLRLHNKFGVCYLLPVLWSFFLHLKIRKKKPYVSSFKISVSDRVAIFWHHRSFFFIRQSIRIVQSVRFSDYIFVKYDNDFGPQQTQQQLAATVVK